MKHGTRSCYINAACRCTECTRANSEYTRRRRRRLLPQVSHGDSAGRMFYLCECADCAPLRFTVGKLDALLRELKSRPCSDCDGRFDPVAMDFDHVRGQKVANVPLLAKASRKEALFAEIEKCEIVCANCHRVRTHTRAVTRSAEIARRRRRPSP